MTIFFMEPDSIEDNGPVFFHHGEGVFRHQAMDIDLRGRKPQLLEDLILIDRFPVLKRPFKFVVYLLNGATRRKDRDVHFFFFHEIPNLDFIRFNTIFVEDYYAN